MAKHSFCRKYLSAVRRDIKGAGIKVNLYVWGPHLGMYEVYDSPVSSYNHVVWCGVACCKWEAMGKALLAVLEEHDEEITESG